MSPSIRSPGGRLRLAPRDTHLLLESKLQGGVVGRHANHVEALVGELACRLATGRVDAAFLAGLSACRENLANGGLELSGDDAVQNRVTNVVAFTPRLS